MSKIILITGANGSVSSAVIGSLKGSGHKLRGLVRNPAKAGALKDAGVEVHVGDLEKPKTLGPAFAGADTVFILTPPGPRAPEQSSNALWAARQADARHIVRMSAIGAAYDAPTINSRMHALSDGELTGSGLPYTILKPHFFLQNLMMAAQSVAQDGTVYMAFGEAKLPAIDVRDIGEFAARLLTTPGHENKTYTITGPAAISMHQFAAALTEALGKPVKYVPVPVEAAVQAIAQLGVDTWTQQALEDYFTAYSRGWASDVTDDYKRVMGKSARSVSEFAHDFAGVFGKK